MNKNLITVEELGIIRPLLKEIASQYSSAEDPEFLRDARLLADDLPRRLRRSLNNFKELEPRPGVCLISGYPVDHSKIGATPDHWKNKTHVSPTLDEEILLVLFASVLGEPFGWSTQQGGHVVHDVLPIKAHEDEQISSGSRQLITWHNEDAFHPYRGDYVGLACLRNPDQVETTLACVDNIKLDQKSVEVLFEPRFIIRPDDSHVVMNGSDIRKASCDGEGTPAPDGRSPGPTEYRIEKVPILFGDPRAPYLRLDPYFMDSLEDDEEARQAFQALVKAIDGCLYGLVLQSGDFCFIDNYRVVHGRKPFTARYDGTDRWLKRINITRDLRKSRDARATSSSRIIL